MLKKMKGISKPYLLQSPMATLKLDWVTWPQWLTYLKFFLPIHPLTKKVFFWNANEAENYLELRIFPKHYWFKVMII
jgi:hypothetical protein